MPTKWWTPEIAEAWLHWGVLILRPYLYGIWNSRDWIQATAVELLWVTGSNLHLHRDSSHHSQFLNPLRHGWNSKMSFLWLVSEEMLARSINWQFFFSILFNSPEVKIYYHSCFLLATHEITVGQYSQTGQFIMLLVIPKLCPPSN